MTLRHRCEEKTINLWSPSQDPFPDRVIPQSDADHVVDVMVATRVVNRERSHGFNIYFSQQQRSSRRLEEDCVHVSALFQVKLRRLLCCLAHLHERPNKIAFEITSATSWKLPRQETTGWQVTNLSRFRINTALDLFWLKEITLIVSRTKCSKCKEN